MKIKHAKLSNVNDIYDLGKNDFKNEKWFTKETLKWNIKANPKLCWILEDKGKIIGARMFCETLGNTVWGWLIVIRKDLRNYGLGKFLFDECCKKLKKMRLRRILTDVNSKNKKSIKWHKKMKYKKLGHVKDWFYKGEDAIIFAKEL
jgi:ribosomal protein S18 acetylase RimI-like enzyme